MLSRARPPHPSGGCRFLPDRWLSDLRQARERSPRERGFHHPRSVEDAGDAEVVLLPPDRAERRTMAAFTSSPNLDEHFTHALFFFTDGTAPSLAADVHAEGTGEKDPTMGLLMADKWSPQVTAISAGIEARLVLDLITQASDRRGFFQAAARTQTRRIRYYPRRKSARADRRRPADSG